VGDIYYKWSLRKVFRPAFSTQKVRQSMWVVNNFVGRSIYKEHCFKGCCPRGCVSERRRRGISFFYAPLPDLESNQDTQLQRLLSYKQTSEEIDKK
jgi:hypothetical protein